MKFKTRSFIASVAAALALSACGGGGDSTDVSAEGLWLTADRTAGLLITPTGELWGIDASDGDITPIIGTASVSGSKVSATAVIYSFDGAFSASMTGPVTAKSSIVATFSALGQSSTTPLSYDSRYDTPASLANLAGSWVTTNGGSVQITAGGSIAGVADGCTFFGNATPDSSGKGFFRASITFGVAPCAYPGKLASGVVAQSGSTAQVVLKLSGVDVATAQVMSKL